MADSDHLERAGSLDDRILELIEQRDAAAARRNQKRAAELQTELTRLVAERDRLRRS